MENVKLVTIVGRKPYTLTTEHSASSYNQPVLVDDNSHTAYGPRDVIQDRFGELRHVGAWVSDSLELVEPAQQDCDTIKAWNRL